MQKTRFYMPTMYGIRTFLRRDGRYALVFGELDQTMIYKDEKLTIDWGNGTQDVITFSSPLYNSIILVEYPPYPPAYPETPLVIPVPPWAPHASI